MINTIKKTIKGLGYLPGYGEHPGIAMFFAFSALGFIAGLTPGIITTVFSGIILCIGAHSRTTSWERSKKN